MNVQRERNRFVPARKRLFSLVLFFLFLSSCNSANTVINPGEELPEFTLSDLEGRPVSLVDQRGKVVVLNFWASWCQPCIHELPALERLHQKMKEVGLVVLGIATEDRRPAVEDLVARLNVTFPILFDDDGIIKRRYGVTAFPETFIIDKLGKLVLIADPEDGMPVAKILGPRDWDNARITKQLTKLLEE